MPIKQERMIELIEAASAYRNAFHTALDEAEQLLRKVADGRMTKTDAVLALQMLTNRLAPEPKHIELLAREREHFRMTRSRNAIRARQMARRRGAKPSSIPKDPLMSLMKARKPALVDFVEPDNIEPGLTDAETKAFDEL